LAVGVALVAGVSYAAVTRDLEASIDRDLLEESRAYAAALAQDPPETVDELIEASRRYMAARQPGSVLAPVLLVRLTDGTVISNADLPLEDVWAGGDAPAVTGFTTVTHEELSYRISTALVRAGDGTLLGVFHAALALDAVYALRDALARSIATIGLSVAAIGGLLSYWVARAALAPLARVAATAGRITQSALTERVAYDGPNDEVGSVVRSLNAMLDRLETAFGEQRRFVADASHELRTPLAVVRGNLDTLCSEGSPAEDRSEAMDAVRGELARMERLVEDLLSLARLESGTHRRPFQPLDVTVLLEEAAGRLRALGGERTVVIDAPERLWVNGDPDLLDAALGNLVRNAWHHTAPRGHITLSARPDDHSVVLSIADDGPGIPAADLKRVFDRFYRGGAPRDDGGGGSGLGRAIVQRLAEFHDGSVSASNPPEGGAVFTVTMPRIEPG
jgi:signal transduction histidine kinase